jgi:hypothetical protein
METPMHAYALTVVLTTAVLAASAPAQTSRPDGPTSRPSRATAPAEGERPLLAGPLVTEEEITAPAERPDRRRLPYRRVLAILRTLDLDEGQEAIVRRTTREMTEAQRAFQREHGPEMRRLRRRANEARNGDAVLSETERTRLRELQRLAPDPSAFLQKIWDDLTPTQQEAFRLGLRDARRRQAATDVPAEMRDLDEVTRRRLRFLMQQRGSRRD